jgi:hypothetical protein
MLCLALAFALANIAVTVSRSLIPRHVSGTADRIEVRREKHAGVDDVWLVHIGGRPVHVDAETASRVREGAALRKDAWDRRLRVGSEVVELGLSDDARGMLWVMPLTLLATAASAATSLRARARR